MHVRKKCTVVRLCRGLIIRGCYLIIADSARNVLELVAFC